MEALLIVCHVMNWEPHRFYLNISETPSADDLAAAEEMIASRARRVPLQHLTGSTEFMGREFAVSPDALVPRPETEILLEAFMEMLPAAPGLLIDAGTGSGILGISLALEFPDALVLGSDISMGALSLAAENSRRYGTDNFRPVGADLLSPVAACSRVDGVVANLPYVRSGDIPGLEPEVRDHDPRLALDGGADGLDLVRRLLEQAPGMIAPGGALALELDPSQVLSVMGLMRGSGAWEGIEVAKDLAGLHRAVRCRGRT